MATPRPSISQYFQIETADNVSYADDFANVQKSLESSKTSYVNLLVDNQIWSLAILALIGMIHGEILKLNMLILVEKLLLDKEQLRTNKEYLN